MTGISLSISESPTKKHAKEPSERWLYRVCGVPQGTPFVLTITSDGLRVLPYLADRPSVLRLSVNAERAVRSWARTQELLKQGAVRSTSVGAGVIICDRPMKRFLLTQKDGKHPNPAFNFKYSYLGGSLDPEETPAVGMVREVFEELRDVRVAEEISAHAQRRPLGGFKLTALTKAGRVGYVVHAFVAMAETDEAYARWRKAILVEGPKSGVAEATAKEVDIRRLTEMLREDRAAPGSHFLADLHVPLQHLLGQVEYTDFV